VKKTLISSFVILAFLISCAQQEVKKTEKQPPEEKKISQALLDYSLGLEHFKQHDYSEALPNFEKALKESSGFVDACVGAAKCFCGIGKFQAAESLYLDFLDKNPGATKARVALANLYAMRKMNDKAKKTFEIAAKRDSTEPYVWDNYASFLNKVGQKDTALKYWERAYSLDPKNKEIAFRLGAAYVAAGQGKKAVSLLESVKEIIPDDIDTRLKLAEAYTDAKMYSKAVEEYKFVISKIPNYVSVIIKLGNDYESLMKYSLAQEQYLHALEIEPKNLSAYYYLINLNIFKLKNYTAAEKYLNRALEINKRDEILWNLRGDTYFYAGIKDMKKENYRSAIKNLTKALAYYNVALSFAKSVNWKKYAKTGIKRSKKYLAQAKDLLW